MKSPTAGVTLRKDKTPPTSQSENAAAVKIQADVLMDRMVVGDSIFIPFQDQTKLYRKDSRALSYVYTTRKLMSKHDVHFITRVETENGVKGVTIYKIEKPMTPESQQ